MNMAVNSINDFANLYMVLIIPFICMLALVFNKIPFTKFRDRTNKILLLKLISLARALFYITAMFGGIVFTKVFFKMLENVVIISIWDYLINFF